jgi:ribosome recycling factor
MIDIIQEQLDKAEQAMHKAYNHTQGEFGKIRAGKALPNMLDGITILYYGNSTPISQVASITTPDARTLLIKPWEKSCIAEIEKAILNSRLALTPQNDGEVVRINIPPLTEERRKDLVKQVKLEAEKGKVVIRNIRKEAKDQLKNLQKEGAAEDLVKKSEDKLQEVTDRFIHKVDELVTQKEAAVMEV